ncbi:MAG: AAA family ATPase [Candidatus Woesearchaeota archaeon]
MNTEYVANQGTGKLDEIRTLALAIKNKENVALSGEPGNGKSTTLKFISNLLGKPYCPRTVNKFEQVFDYKGAPIIMNGNVIYTDTMLKRALRTGGVFVNEESSELSEPIQKYLSQLLADRESFTIIDEHGNEFTLKEMKEKFDWKIDDFVYSETFNPLHNETGRDNFVDSHRDRMNLKKYNDLDSLLSVYIALNDIGIKTKLPLTERGIIYDSDADKLIFTEQNKDRIWKDVSGKEVSKINLSKQKTYMFFNKEQFKDSDRESYIKSVDELDPFYIEAVKYFIGLKHLINKEPSMDSLSKYVKTEYVRDEAVGELKIVYPTLRLIKNTFKRYNSLVESGFGKEKARETVITDAINNITYGALANKSYNGSGTQEVFLTSKARSADLLPKIENASNEL